MIEFTIAGRMFRLDRSQVETTMETLSPKPIRVHWVEINGCRWPVKQALEATTGISSTHFNAHTAIRHLRQLGFTTTPLPSETDQATAAPKPADTVELDTDQAATAFGTLTSFLGSMTLTRHIAELEAALAGADQTAAAATMSGSGLSPDVLQAALTVRQHAGRINDIIHAAVIMQVLPMILEPGEHVTVRPSLAAGNDPGRPFDLETDRRVAEFKVSLWKGADAMRKRGVFQDFVHLALDQSGRRRQLFVVGDRPIEFLRASTSPARWALNRASPQLRARFEEHFGALDIPIREFTHHQASNIDLINIATLLPALDQT